MLSRTPEQNTVSAVPIEDGNNENTPLIKRDTMENQQTTEVNAQGKSILRKNFVGANMGATAAADGTLLALIFGLHAVPWLLALLKPILFPIAPVIAAAKMVWSWVNVALDRAKNSVGVVDAVMSTVMFLAITAAVIIAFTALAALTPVIFTAAMGLSTLYEAGKTIYHLVKAARSETKEERKQHLHGAGMSALSTGIGAAMTVAVGGLMLGGIKAFMWVGVAAAGTVVTVGTGLMIKGIYDLVKNWRAKKKAALTNNIIISDNTPKPNNAPDLNNKNTPSNVVQMEKILTSNLENDFEEVHRNEDQVLEKIEVQIQEKAKQFDVIEVKTEVLPFNVLKETIPYGTLSKNTSTHFGSSAKLAAMSKQENVDETKKVTDNFIPRSLVL